jgi:hypothetical protein
MPEHAFTKVCVGRQFSPHPDAMLVVVHGTTCSPSTGIRRNQTRFSFPLQSRREGTIKATFGSDPQRSQNACRDPESFRNSLVQRTHLETNKDVRIPHRRSRTGAPMTAATVGGNLIPIANTACKTRVRGKSRATLPPRRHWGDSR